MLGEVAFLHTLKPDQNPLYPFEGNTSGRKLEDLAVAVGEVLRLGRGGSHRWLRARARRREAQGLDRGAGGWRAARLVHDQARARRRPGSDLVLDSASSFTNIDDIPLAGVDRDLLVFDLSSSPAVTHYDGTAHPPVIVAGGPDT